MDNLGPIPHQAVQKIKSFWTYAKNRIILKKFICATKSVLSIIFDSLGICLHVVIRKYQYTHTGIINSLARSIYFEKELLIRFRSLFQMYRVVLVLN